MQAAISGGNTSMHGDAELIAASMRPMHAGWRFWAIFGVLAVIVAAGVGAWVYQVTHGLGVTGMNNGVFWAVYESNLVAFIGFSYGGAVVSAILRLAQARWRAPITRLAEAMALVTLSVGSLFAFIHVGHPERLWEFFTRPHVTSPLVWDATAIATYLVATLLFLYLPLIPDVASARKALGPRASAWRRKLYSILAVGWEDRAAQRRLLQWGMTITAILIIPLAVSVHSVLAWAFGLTLRPGWHSSIFGPYFVVAALLSGVAMVILVLSAYRTAYHLDQYITPQHFRRLSYLILTLGLAYLYLTIADLLTEGYMADADAGSVLSSLLIGRFAPLYWLFLIGGGAIPTILVVLPWTSNVKGITVAAALTVVAMWLKRVLIVVPPLYHNFAFPSESNSYSASIVEILVTLGASAAVPLLLMVFFRFFPVLSVHEITELSTEPAPEEAPESIPVPRGALRGAGFASEQGGS